MHVSAHFRTWLVAQVFGSQLSLATFVGAWHSVSHPVYHESDLVFVFTAESGSRVALLIENKIDAPPQPEQAARYGKRGETGIVDGNWDEYRTCIIAPEGYLYSEPEATIYHAQVSYESIRQWLLNLGDERSVYRARFVAEAIEQNRRGYRAIPHVHVTTFWQDYWLLTTREFTALQMKRPSKVPRGSDWPILRASHMGSDRRILHKWAMGVVDLQLDGAGGHAKSIAEAYGSVFEPEGMVVVETGKSASVRLLVPVIQSLEEFSEQIQAIRTGLHAAARLQAVSRTLVWPLPSKQLLEAGGTDTTIMSR